jgi:SOS-response transcriptional repressor LexA
MCDTPPVGNVVDMQAIRAALERAMERKGIKPKRLAMAAGLGETAVRDILKMDTSDVKVGTLVRLASVLDCDLKDLLGAPRVPVAGYIGAGGTVIFEELHDEEPVLRPPAISGPVIALQVRGDSMFPKYESGDIIYIQRQHGGVLPEYIGEYCAVRLKDGSTFLKKLAFGSKEGLFTLVSLNAADMVDVEVEWATPVLFVMPRRSRSLTGG